MYYKLQKWKIKKCTKLQQAVLVLILWQNLKVLSEANNVAGKEENNFRIIQIALVNNHKIQVMCSYCISVQLIRVWKVVYNCYHCVLFDYICDLPHTHIHFYICVYIDIYIYLSLHPSTHLHNISPLCLCSCY